MHNYRSGIVAVAVLLDGEGTDVWGGAWQHGHIGRLPYTSSTGGWYSGGPTLETQTQINRLKCTQCAYTGVKADIALPGEPHLRANGTLLAIWDHSFQFPPVTASKSSAWAQVYSKVYITIFIYVGGAGCAIFDRKIFHQRPKKLLT